MGKKTLIEWTDATWSAIRARYTQIQNDGSGKERLGWHCEHVSEGCRHCYAERLNQRLGTGLEFKPDQLAHDTRFGERQNGARIFLDEQMLLAPLRWRKPRRIFVCSMTDLFARFVPDDMIDHVFAVMALSPHHTFQVLTKRPKRMRDYFANPGVVKRIYRLVNDLASNLVIPYEICMPGYVAFTPPERRIMFGTWPIPNVWLGTSIEDQATADTRVPDLLATPATVRFVSAEPLLGQVDLSRVMLGENTYVDARTGLCGAFAEPPPGGWKNGINDALAALPAVPERRSAVDWVICGGESGPGARPMNPAWARLLRDQCRSAGVAFFHKQNGEYVPVADASGSPRESLSRVGKKAAGRLLDGREWSEFPR